MPYEIVMPRLGWTMEEGTFVEWLKHDGDQVSMGDLICSVEGDKAINEIESFESGTLYIPPEAPPAGLKVKVGTLLGYILAPGEAKPSGATADGGRQTADSVAPAPQNGNASTAVVGQPSAVVASAPTAAPTISPRARRIASELGVSWQSVKGSGRTGRIVERDIRAAAVGAHSRAPAQPAQSGQPQGIAPTPTAAELRISPLAQRRATELGVNLQALAAAQPGKRIDVADVESAARAATTPAPAGQGQPAGQPQGIAPTPAALGAGLAPAQAGVAKPISSVRRLIGDRMTTSALSTAAVTLTTEADATELVRLRKSIAADLQGTSNPTPSYNDLLAKLCAVALQEFPALNASLDGDTIMQHAAVHIGIAVDTERGLLVPVVRDVQSKSVQAIAAESAKLIEQVRAGKVNADALRGGTFSISNLGMYEIDAFTPIINLPECAILGVGRIVAKQIVVDADNELVAIRKMVALSLTFDHRLVDGAPAARFLQRIKQFVEHPYAWLTK